jgi:hypothetical protein
VHTTGYWGSGCALPNSLIGTRGLHGPKKTKQDQAEGRDMLVGCTIAFLVQFLGSSLLPFAVNISSGASWLYAGIGQIVQVDERRTKYCILDLFVKGPRRRARSPRDELSPLPTWRRLSWLAVQHLEQCYLIVASLSLGKGLRPIEQRPKQTPCTACVHSPCSSQQYAATSTTGHELRTCRVAVLRISTSG